MKELKKKKAQQVVEFLLIAPFVIGFLAFFTEYAYALNINLTLTKALKTSTASLYQNAKPNITQESITEFIKDKFIKELENNGIPINDENNINVSCIKTKNTGIFMATYTYYPAFSLPTIFFNILPKKFNFMTTVPVPKALLEENNYSSSINTEALDGIWQASTFSNLETFDGHKYGILNQETGRSKILFLFPSNEFTDQNDTYLILNWNGVPISSTKSVGEGESATSETFYTVYSKNKNKLLECSAIDKTCSETNNTLYNYILSNNKSYIYIINESSAPKAESGETISITASNINNYWLYDNNTNALDANSTSDISSNNIYGILKNTIALVNSNEKQKAIGNYDNLPCSNSEICSLINMVYSFGSMIFIDSSSEIRDKVTAGKQRPDFSNFGS